MSRHKQPWTYAVGPAPSRLAGHQQELHGPQRRTARTCDRRARSRDSLLDARRARVNVRRLRCLGERTTSTSKCQAARYRQANAPPAILSSAIAHVATIVRRANVGAGSVEPLWPSHFRFISPPDRSRESIGPTSNVSGRPRSNRSTALEPGARWGRYCGCELPRGHSPAPAALARECPTRCLLICGGVSSRSHVKRAA
jgi:hypothetical protein